MGKLEGILVLESLVQFEFPPHEVMRVYVGGFYIFQGTKGGGSLVRNSRAYLSG